MIFKQYLKVFLRNIKSVLITFSIFVIIFLIMSKNDSNSTKFENIKLHIVVNNFDNSEHSKKFIEYLSKSNSVKEENISINEARKRIFDDKIDAYIEIKENLTENLKNKKSPISIIGAENSYRFEFLKIDVNKYFAYKITQINSNKSDKEFEDTLNKTVNIKITNDSLYNEEKLKSTYSYSFGISSYVIFLSILSVLANISIEFKDKNILRRLKIAPTNATKLVVSQFLSQIIIATIITGLFSSYLAFQFRNHLNDFDFTKIVIALLIYAFTSVSISQVFTSITDNIKILNNLTNILSLIMSFSSGIFIPAKFIPKFILNFSRFLPQIYIVDFLNEVSLNSLLKFTLIQGLFITFFILLSIFIKKIKTTT